MAEKISPLVELLARKDAAIAELKEELAAEREKQEREQREAPKPLTLEELRELGGEPVYIMRVEADKIKPGKCSEGWYLVEAKLQAVAQIHGKCSSFDDRFKTVETAGGVTRFGYNAYRTKPEGSEKE